MNEFLQSADVWLPGLLAMLGLVIASAFFSSSETALFFLSHEELRRFRRGTTAQRSVASLLADADRLLTGILFWNLVVNLTYFAVGVVVTQQLHAAGQPVAGGAFGLFSLLLIILFGEVLPKSVAVSWRTTVAVPCAVPLALAIRVLDPVIPTLTRLTRTLRRTFWPHVVREPQLGTDDLELAVETSPLSDEARRRERIVLHNVLDLSEIAVEEVMRPRGTYVSLQPPISLAELRGEVPPTDYVMVQESDSEGIAGAIPLTRLARIPSTDLQNAAEDVLHVPWCANAADTLQQLREKLCGVAVVVNEYGETIGIVTAEDLVDTVVVPEPSRARRLLRREPVLEIEPGRYHVDGLTTLRYLSRRIGVDFQSEDVEQFTVAGLLSSELEHVPQAGDVCQWRGYLFVVIEGGRRGGVRVLVEAPRTPTGHLERSTEETS